MKILLCLRILAKKQHKNFGDKNRQTYKNYSQKVDEHKCSPSILTHHIWKLPYISKPNSTTSCRHYKTNSTKSSCFQNPYSLLIQNIKLGILVKINQIKLKDNKLNLCYSIAKYLGVWNQKAW